MASKSNIEWTDASWTPIRARNLKTGKVGWYCEHSTTGCEFCYAEGMNKRLGTGLPFKPGHRKDVEIFLDEKMLLAPLRWKKPRMIFVCSMTDLFADFVPDEWIDKVFAVMALSPQHTFQVLTKRAERMRGYFREFALTRRLLQVIADLDFRGDTGRGIQEGVLKVEAEEVIFDCWPLPNVWLGVSAEHQEAADERIPHLLNTPAAVRFVSAEPLLGPVDLSHICILPQKPGSIRAGIHLNALTGRYCESGVTYTGDWDVTGPAPPVGTPARKLDWIIAGGESGHKNPRPMHPDWARSLRDQCAAAGVAFFFKQWGGWKPHRVMPGGDLGGDVRAGRVRIVHPSGRSDVEISEATGGHSTESGSRYMECVGKKAAGRLLDGIEHNAMPNPRRSA